MGFQPFGCQSVLEHALILVWHTLAINQADPIFKKKWCPINRQQWPSRPISQARRHTRGEATTEQHKEEIEAAKEVGDLEWGNHDLLLCPRFPPYPEVLTAREPQREVAGPRVDGGETRRTPFPHPGESPSSELVAHVSLIAGLAVGDGEKSM